MLRLRHPQAKSPADRPAPKSLPAGTSPQNPPWHGYAIRRHIAAKSPVSRLRHPQTNSLPNRSVPIRIFARCLVGETSRKSNSARHQIAAKSPMARLRHPEANRRTNRSAQKSLLTGTSPQNPLCPGYTTRRQIRFQTAPSRFADSQARLKGRLPRKSNSTRWHIIPKSPVPRLRHPQAKFPALHHAPKSLLAGTSSQNHP